jgi:hypothetical protein
LLERKPRKLAAVALANKMARIICAMMAKRTGASRSPSEPRAAAEGLKGKQEMAIGRTDERRNPLIPVALTGRAVVWMSLADPICQRTASRVKGRTNDRIRTKVNISQTYSNPTGRPHLVL